MTTLTDTEIEQTISELTMLYLRYIINKAEFLRHVEITINMSERFLKGSDKYNGTQVQRN